MSIIKRITLAATGAILTASLGACAAADPTPATKGAEGVEAAERLLVQAYDGKKWHAAYALQSHRCRVATDFDTFSSQIIAAFETILPENFDWTIEKVDVKVGKDGKSATAEVLIPGMNDVLGDGDVDKWVYEKDDGQTPEGWKLDDCEK